MSVEDEARRRHEWDLRLLRRRLLRRGEREAAATVGRALDGDPDALLAVARMLADEDVGPGVAR